MGSLGLGASVSGSEKLTVGGTASFSGAITGNLTGNASGTAATVTTAAQTNITSLGTLTALQIDNVNIDGNTMDNFYVIMCFIAIVIICWCYGVGYW